MSLKFTGKLCVRTMKNGATFEEELTFQFKADMRNLTNFDPSTQKISIICTLMSCLLPYYIMFELKKSTEVLFLMALKIDANFKGLVFLKNDMANWANFCSQGEK